MKFNYYVVSSKDLACSLFGALLVMGCSAGEGDPLGGVTESLRAGQAQGPRSRGPRGGGHSGGHRPGGHHPGGSDGGSDPTNCVASNTLDSIYAEVANDLAGQDSEDSIFIRYLSLANQANVKGCGSALDVDRAALNKLVNSVSIDPTLERPVPVDANQTLYRIDLRHYGWDRPIQVSGTQFADGWEALIASSPYAVPIVGDDADDAAADSGTTVPVLFGSAFVAAASAAPLYHALLGIPADIDDFLSNDLAVDVTADPAIRAGFSGTSVARSGGEFIAERFAIQVRTGSVWQISELGARNGLLEDPLGAAEGERELVFTLPNGLQGHVLADADGRVRNASDVVVDELERDLRAKVAHSYLREHAQGPEVEDQVRQFVTDNPSSFTPEEVAAILDAYASAADLEQALAGDRSVFAQALQGLGLDIDDAPEPVAQAFVSFGADVDLAAAAGDLLVSEGVLRDNLGLLHPVLGALDGGTRSRDGFTRFYVQSLCVMSAVLENQPDPSVCD